MEHRSEGNEDSFGLGSIFFEKTDEFDKKNTKHLEVTFCGGPNAGIKLNDVGSQDYLQQSNTCRILQRKLELKVEKAKRNYNQYQDLCLKKSQSSSLIPINRLQIPGFLENQPLVDYKSDSDEQDEISFFPIKCKNEKKLELSDTFSIQEMTIESDNSNDSDISQNLELLSPRLKTNIFNRVLNCFYCVHSEI